MGSESQSGNDSDCGGGEGGGGQEAAQGVPATAKKVVQSVKEIVNCTEHEIYAVLKECDMDPNRAVERLLAQDTFHEVRSKRERRKDKEMKEALDSRVWSNNVVLSRVGKTGTVSERSVVQSGSGLAHVIHNEHGKAVDYGKVGSVCCPSVTCSMTHIVEKNKKSDYLRTDNGRQSLRTGLGPQPSLVGASKVHLSMADIVRMGRTSQDAVSDYHFNIPGVSAPGNFESSLSQHFQNCSEQQVFHDEWPVTEQPNTGNSLALNTSAAIANGSFEHPTMQVTDLILRRDCELDAAQFSSRSVACDNVFSEKAESDSTCSNHSILSSDAGLGSHSKSYLKNTCSSDFRSSYEHDEDVSPVASDFQQLSVRESKMEVPSSEDSLTVVIPYHLRALAADCSHLYFGSYNSGNNSASSAFLASNNLSRSGLEEKSAAIDSSAQFVDPSSANIGNKQHRFDVLRGTARDKSHNFLSSPQQELVKHIVPEETLERGYNVAACISDPRLLKSDWVAPPLPMKQPDIQTENHPTFPRELHADSNLVAGDMFAFLTPQSQLTRYSNSVSSIGNTAIPTPEVMELSAYALPKGSALPQDIAEQSSIHNQQLPDINVYQSLPQNKSYMPTINAQQAFSGNTRYNQSPADMEYNLHQNRNEFLMSRLPPAAARDAFGFGNPNSSFHSHGSFLPMSNPSAGYMIPSRNFDEILPSQYSGGQSSIQLHGNSSRWDHGAESRSLPLQEETLHNFLGQPSQASLSQYARLGYGDLYHSNSQSPVLVEPQQPDGFQDLLSKQLRQFWQQGHQH